MIITASNKFESKKKDPTRGRTWQTHNNLVSIKIYLVSMALNKNSLLKTVPLIFLMFHRLLTKTHSVLGISSIQSTISKMTTTTATLPTLSWTRITPQPDPDHGVPCTRSSHGVSAITCTDGTTGLFVYGGEHIARTPIENNNAGWICSNNMSQWKWIDCSAAAPSPRVAHAQACYDNRYVYIFGGRTGIGMDESPLDDMWMFDTTTEKWTSVSTTGDIPPARSFHRMICINNNLYLFGGCGSSGRLNDLYQFNINTKVWSNLGTSLLRGRGGPNVFPIQSNTAIAIVGGFAGEETNDGHIYSIANGKWTETVLATELQDLRPRSVCVSGSFPSVGVSLLFGGEVDPSDRGHEGAGGFENDIVLLDESTGHLLQTIKSSTSTNEWPEQRGWSDCASIDNGNGTGQLYVFGGLTGDDATPQRLNDLWKLDISKAKNGHA
jgi:Galactose oxidase, central domain